MQIINDTEVFEPKECYFCIVPASENNDFTMSVCISPIDFWQENQCLSDTFGDHSLSLKIIRSLENLGLFCETDAVWSGDVSEQDARKLMLQLGFVENAGMLDAIRDFY